MLFLSSHYFLQIQVLNNTPYILTAIIENSSIELSTLSGFEGITRISPVLNLDTLLSVGDYTMDCEIEAVYSSFLDLSIIQGTMYPDDSNMPYLLLNESAAKSFSYERLSLEVSIGDSVMISVNGRETKAVVCGIFSNDSENPTVYMSYEVARKEYGSGSHNRLLILLDNWKETKKIANLLRKQNIQLEYDSSIIMLGETLQKECIQILCLCISILTCSLVLIREKRKIEIHTCRYEIKSLLVSGMTEQNVENTYLIRIALMQLICLCLSAVASLVIGIYTTTAVKLACYFFACWLIVEHIVNKKEFS